MKKQEQKVLRVRCEIRPFQGLLFVLFLLLFLPVHAASSQGGEGGDEITSRFRLGPFFEYRKSRSGGTFWAIRPFYSQLDDPASRTAIKDTLWPLATWHLQKEGSWWRALLAYGSNDNISDPDSAWKIALFPLYFQGRTREKEGYWALFPIYGHLPHVLLMEDIDFILFPLYMNYEVNGVERRSYLWPIFSRRDSRDHETRTGVFPFYGERKSREGESTYAFWPFWTSNIYTERENPGSSWMLWPLYGEVDRRREQQTLVLPPLFSHAKTDRADRWRMPWPFYQTLDTAEEKVRHFWPFYRHAAYKGDESTHILWPLFEHSTVETAKSRTVRRRYLLIFSRETVYSREGDGEWREKSDFVRLWPLFSRESNAERDCLRTLELNPFRYSGGIERNWAPFWTLYERTLTPESSRHDALWGVFKWSFRAPKDPQKIENKESVP